MDAAPRHRQRGGEALRPDGHTGPTSAGSTPRHVFISHAWADRDIAARLAEMLRAEGIDVLPEVAMIRAGGMSEHAVRQALDAADAVVVLVSADQGGWTRFEWSEVVKRAWADRDLIVLPVLLDETDLPGFLRDLHAIRFDEDIDRGLVEAVAAVLEPRERGVRRTEAGEIRLQHRLAELESAAVVLAEAVEAE